MPATAFKLTIPKPCHNNWQNMMPTEKGRFCSNCNKTVTDFTQFSDSEITSYFIQHDPAATCGRFYTKQLDRITIHIPQYVLHKRLPLWKHFLVILLICFGSTMFSIEVKAGNGFKNYTETTTKKNKRIKKKKRRHYYISIYPGKWDPLPSTEIEMQVLGGLGIQDAPGPDPFMEDILFRPAYGSPYKGKHKKPSPFKKTIPPIEAALPAALAVKTAARKKKRTKAAST